MTELYVKTILAGILFALWPLFMNRSGLPRIASTFVFGGLVMLCSMPLTYGYGQFVSMQKANWGPMFVAGVVATIGCLAFNSMLSKAKIEDIGTLCLTMILTQIGTTAVYQAIIAKSIPLNRGIGLALAIGAAIMLNRR